MADLDWDEFIDAIENIKEWAEAEGRDDVMSAIDVLIAAVKERGRE